ncbi:hypothetical protein CsSME_00009246 [Camellia sinensis var. sinensis]
MTTVVRSLGGFLIQEANNLGGLRPQVDQLQAQLNRMQCFLVAADARPRGGPEGDEIIMHQCVAEIREASYDAEAAIATFLVKIAFRTSERSDQFPFILKRYLCIFKECLALREVRLEIEAINTRITNSLTTGFQTCGILNSTGVVESSSSTSLAERQRQLRRSYTHIVEEDVVGTEEDVKAVVDLLVKENTNYRVVSIWGMGGLGKTTLAKTVYKHIEIRRHFKCVAWAYVSQQCNTRDVLVEILIKLLSPPKEEREEIEKSKHHDLVKKLHQVQSEKKCLVILDDIWKDADWDSLSPGFPNTTEVGSKLLLTTRNENVAKHVDQQCVLYKLRHLTEKESWELFEKTLFRRNEGTDSRVLDTNMKALGREMVKLCAGLPLAIIVFGGLLATKHTVRKWEKVYQNVRSRKWSDDPIQHYDGVLEVLALSYHDLPDQFKLCFLYFGHFSEDFEIDAERLYNLWIADDIIIDADRVGDETIMDVAKRYLGALAQRCMVQVQVEEHTQEINYCRIHHHMLDLCLLEAKKNNFLRIIHLQHKTDLTDYLSTTLTTTTLEIRKLAIHLNRDIERVVLPDLVTTKQLRSILFYNPRRDNESSIELKSHFKNFKLLRNLDLEGFKFDEKLVKSIGNLICLRYLSFRHCFMPKWHSSICKLKYLQTLDLRGCNFNLGEEIVLHSMEGLRHLFISLNLNFRNKFKLDGLRKLETFEGFNTWNCDVNDLFKLINLRQLDATFSETENSEDFGAFLDYVNNSTNHLRQTSLSVYFSFEEEKLTILKQLLGCHHLYKLSVFGFIVKLPKYQDFSSSIIKLQLCSCKLQEDPMPTLERLLRLQFLNLDFDAFVGDKMVCSDNGFPQLKTLQLHCLKHLKEWEVEIGALPNLTVLAIHYCQGLEMVPEGLRFIATLQQFTIQEMSEKFNNKLRGVNGEEGEDFYKVRHVSSVNIQ